MKERNKANKHNKARLNIGQAIKFSIQSQRVGLISNNNYQRHLMWKETHAVAVGICCI